MREGKPRRVKAGWRIRVSDEHGRRRKRTFPSHGEALKALTAEKARVGEVKDGTRAPEPRDRNFEDLSSSWTVAKVPTKRSGHHDLSIIRCHLLPAFGSVKLRDLAREGVPPAAPGVTPIEDFINRKSTEVGPKTLANILTLFISMLNRAVNLGWLHVAPKVKKPRIDIADEDFDYLRSDEEAGRFLDAAAQEGEFVHVLYAAAIYTGMRAGELAGLLWANVNLGQRLITVKHSYGGVTKSGKNRQVPILDPLLPLLRQWRLKCPGIYVFPNQAGQMLGPSARVFQEILHRVLDAASFPKTETNGRVRRYIVFHDLRHTFASRWMMMGGTIFKLQKILGHKDIKMTQRYSHLAPEAFGEDYGRLGSALPTTGKVIVVDIAAIAPDDSASCRT
jgi:integrase